MKRRLSDSSDCLGISVRLTPKTIGSFSLSLCKHITGKVSAHQYDPLARGSGGSKIPGNPFLENLENQQTRHDPWGEGGQCCSKN